MSTYYNFYCSKCEKEQKGTSFTRQMWGWGNAEIIDTFRFLMKHTELCGHEHIRIMCEDDDDFFKEDFKEDIDDDLNGYFPRSEDWSPQIRSREIDKYHKHWDEPQNKGKIDAMGVYK